MSVLKWLLHASVLLFAICIGTAFLTTKTAEIQLKEGVTESLPGWMSSCGKFDRLLLDQFSVKKGKNGSPYYQSDISAMHSSAADHFTVSVNRPAKLSSLRLYQKSYSIGFKSLKIEWEGKTHDLLTENQDLIMKDGEVFRFYPVEMTGHQLTYRYETTDNSGRPAHSGDFSRTVSDPFLKQIGFKIQSESAEAVSTLLAVYAPFLWPLGFSAVLFLLMLGLSLWVKDAGKAGKRWN